MLVHPSVRVRQVLTATACLLAFALVTAPVHAGEPAADPEPVAKPAPPKPWDKGVTPEQRQSAEALFGAGNRFFADKDYAKALAQYQKAVAVWDHPAIRFNTAIAQLELNDRRGAYASLKAALRYGKGPLSERNHDEGRRLFREMRNGFAFVTIVCDEPGASVRLNGKALFVGPGKVERILEPGDHALVAEKSGFKKTSLTFKAGGGRKDTVNLLVAPLTKTVTDYPMPPAVPWATLVSGVVIAAAGAPLWLVADASLQEQVDALDRACAADGFCEGLPANVASIGDRAGAERAGSIAMFAIGGVAAVAGAILLAVNQPETREVPITAKSVDVSVVPALGGAALGLRF